jgi:hypothetical protein
MEKYGFEDYVDQLAPCVFFGCYGPSDYSAINEHRGLAVLVWMGSDAMRDNPNLLFDKHVKHIAISKWIEKDMERIGLDYISLPVTHTIHDDLKPEYRGKYIVLGRSIYCYCPEGKEFYGWSIGLLYGVAVD